MVPAPSPALEVQPDMRAFRLLSECPLPTEAGDSMLRIYGDGTCSPWPVRALVFGQGVRVGAPVVRTFAVWGGAGGRIWAG